VNPREALRTGEVVLLPTDTLPGLHARADHPDAAARLRACKGSDEGRPFLLLIGAVAAVWSHGECATDVQRRTLEGLWPGPITALLRPRATTPTGWVHEERSVAIRVPRPEALRELIAGLGSPLFSTSANRAGEPPARTLAAARARFPDLYWIDLATPTAEGASTIVDLTRPEARVVRAGSVVWPAS